MKSIICTLTMTFTLILTGCATAMLATAPLQSSSTEREFLHDDIITTVGQVREHDNLILFGQQNTYVMTNADGVTALKQLMKLDAKKISLNNDQEINLNVTGNRFSSMLTVRYYSDDVTTHDELLAMKTIGFQQVGKTARGMEHLKRIKAVGTVYAKYAQIPDNNTQLQKAREIKVYSVTTHNNVDTKRALDMAATLPLTVTFDLVTLPLQLIFLTSQNH